MQHVRQETLLLILQPVMSIRTCQKRLQHSARECCAGHLQLPEPLALFLLRCLIARQAGFGSDQNFRSSCLPAFAPVRKPHTVRNPTRKRPTQQQRNSLPCHSAMAARKLPWGQVHLCCCSSKTDKLLTPSLWPSTGCRLRLLPPADQSLGSAGALSGFSWICSCSSRLLHGISYCMCSLLHKNTEAQVSLCTCNKN